MLRKNLLEGSLYKHLWDLSLPSIGGMFTIIIFNLTDTYFVAQLGTNELAAMGFTFPVVMLIGSVIMGIGIGIGSIIARAVGKQDYLLVQRISRDGILLAIVLVIFISIGGILSLDAVFKFLGAQEHLLPLVKEYMFVWYCGVLAAVLPPLCDAPMRALGDMKRPFFVMLTCALINIILDPILIFGYFGVPAMGIRGAALATIIARCAGVLTSLSFLYFKYHLFNSKYLHPMHVLALWKRILTIGIPAISVGVCPQIIRALLTYLVARGAETAGVAALAAGSRLEGFSLIISMAVGQALIPLVGQNFGAKNHERVLKLCTLVSKLAILYGFFLFILSLLFGKLAARIFTSDLAVIDFTSSYLNIVLIGSIGLNLYTWLSQSFNAAGMARKSLLINGLGTLFIIIPAILIGFYLGDFIGLLVGLALGQVLLGAIAFFSCQRSFQLAS